MFGLEQRVSRRVNVEGVVEQREEAVKSNRGFRGKQRPQGLVNVTLVIIKVPAPNLQKVCKAFAALFSTEFAILHSEWH